MAVEVTIPEVGESITEGILAEWSKADGDYVHADEPLLVLETDKITMTVNAEAAGRLAIQVPEGETVQIGQVVGTIDTEAAAPSLESRAVADESEPETAPEPPAEEQPTAAEPPPLSAPAGRPQAAEKLDMVRGLSPAVQRLVLEHHLSPSDIEGTGRGGRVTKADVVRYIERRSQTRPPESPQEAATGSQPSTEGAAAPAKPSPGPGEPTPGHAEPPAPVALVRERQSREPMSRLRQRVAERLVEVQQTAAILTTFNEVDMSRVMALRAAYKERFLKEHGIGLGFMSFFVKASIDALQTVPEVNTLIDGDELVRNHYYDIGIAVSTDRGLVVPVLRSADQLSMAEIEEQIADYAQRAQERKLELSELTGAIFTISNGGVFGSMMSTPILNPPGSAILGMHAITKRAVVVDDEIVIRPMMYLALSYDHRVIDGREAVTFLKRIRECIENPERMLLEI